MDLLELFSDSGNAKDKKNNVQHPHDSNGDACVWVIGQEYGNAHEGGYGEHDAQFLCDGHAASSVPHKEHGLAIDLCRAQPCIHAVRPSGKTEGRKQNERNGRQDGKKGTKYTESQAEKTEGYIENFFENHWISSKL